MPRHFYPALLLLLSAFAASAQTSPSINNTDMPVVNDTLRLSQAAPVLPASAPPLTRRGANQTWNYGALQPTSQRVERYAAVSSTPLLLRATFGALGSPANRANLVSPQNLPLPPGTTLPIADPLAFYNNSVADYRSVGFGANVSGLALPVTYPSQAQQDIIYRFPLSFSSQPDSSSSYFEANAPGAGFFSQRRKRVNRPDAWGTLTTPFGTFQTVRVVTRLEDRDSLAIGAGPGQSITLPVRREYKWLAKTIHVPVLTITTAVVNGQESIINVEYRDVYRRLRTLSAIATAVSAVTAWPTAAPAGEAVRLQLQAPAVVDVCDLSGRQLGQFRLAAGTAALPLSAAWRGTFILRIYHPDGHIAIGKLVRY